MFIVDGVEWTIPCDITRTSEITASELSGMMLNRMYFNDILGTYLQYEVKLVPIPSQMGEYYTLMDVLTQPVGEHEFTMPYDNGEVTFTGRVEQISDVYVRMPGGGTYWKGVTFTAVSIAPTKEMSHSEAISRGLPALPDVAMPNIGDTYTWTVNGWEAASGYPDADTTAY